MSKSLRSLEGETLSGRHGVHLPHRAPGDREHYPSGRRRDPRGEQRDRGHLQLPRRSSNTSLPFIRLEADGARGPLQRGANGDQRTRASSGPYENADRLVSLKPAAALPRDADVKVIVSRGAKPRPENYGTPEDISAVFHTLTPLAAGIQRSDHGRSVGRRSASVQPRAHRRDRAAEPRGPAKGYKLDSNMEVSGSWVYLSKLPVPFESSFDMQFLRGIKDIYGQSLGKDQTGDPGGRAGGHLRAFPRRRPEAPGVAVSPASRRGVPERHFGEVRHGLLEGPFPAKPGTRARGWTPAACRRTRGISRCSTSPRTSTETTRERPGCPGLSWESSRKATPRRR